MKLASSTTRRSGFSMVEVLLVVMILGLIAGIVVVSWQSMLPSTRLNSAVHTLAATLYGTRSDAISRNADFLLTYDLDANRYEVRAPFQADGKRAREDKDRASIRAETLKDRVELRSVIVNGVSHQDGKVTVRFDPHGQVSEHSVVLAQGLDDAVENTYTVEVLPLTGLIRLHDGQYLRDPVDEGDFE